MSSATVSVNLKLQDGTLVQVGGVGFDDFHTTRVAFAGVETADAVVASVKDRLVPLSAGGPAPAAPQRQQFQQAQQTVQAAFPQAQQVETCPSHNQPVRWRERKDGTGSFAVCTVNDSIVSNFGKPGLRNACPPPKAR